MMDFERMSKEELVNCLKSEAEQLTNYGLVFILAFLDGLPELKENER